MVEYKIKSRKTRERESRIAATEAAKSFGRLVDRVREERATYVVERGGRPVAQISPIERRHFTLADFAALLRRLPRVDDEYLTAVEDAAARHNKPRVPDNPWER
jgi:antitoxin (DNA-binding transcriptional repressor) of toxin-antitoxin stability system